MTIVYLDQDDVLADLTGALRKRGINSDTTFYHKPEHEKTQEQKDLETKVKACFEEPMFFQTLPFMEWAGLLWGVVKEPVILTARPSGMPHIASRVTQEKRLWAERYFGPLPEDRFICCERPEKKKYAQGNILVDDSEKNCSEWCDNGGLAILFKTAKQATEELRRLVEGP